MSEIQFMVGGRAMTEAQFKAQAIKTTKPKSEGPKEYHKGFRVEGHPPGAMESAKLAREGDIADAQRMLEQGRRETKVPKPWDANFWRMTTKKRPVRAKPYEVPEAAAICKTMAEKAGWLDVVIVEMKRS